MNENTKSEKIVAEVSIDEFGMTLHNEFLLGLKESLSEKCEDVELETLEATEREGSDWTLKLTGPKDQVSTYMSNLYMFADKLKELHKDLEKVIGKENIDYQFL